ncbi:unnamed protein product [Parnassius apollo]|uniref:(apollo) hypothetical protein n=1 Tax=Parnassius apollo TaxID=110799 RepID=A0A8S3WPJ0_PARAO|nr:unnamed protein product [Parnassius apollo]
MSGIVLPYLTDGGLKEGDVIRACVCVCVCGGQRGDGGGRRVAWRAGVAAGARAGRLHRRDTPHHLKNKRVSHIDAARARDLIAQVLACHALHHLCSTVPCREPRRLLHCVDTFTIYTHPRPAQ